MALREKYENKANKFLKVIEINFTSFHLPTRLATCAMADANVTLRDGEHANSPLVGVFCGPRGSTMVSCLLFIFSYLNLN